MKANYLILAVASFICLTSCNAKLPEEAKSVIFQSPTFQKPIYVSVPQPDEESSFLNFLEYPTITDESFIVRQYAFKMIDRISNADRNNFFYKNKP